MGWNASWISHAVRESFLEIHIFPPKRHVLKWCFIDVSLCSLFFHYFQNVFHFFHWSFIILKMVFIMFICFSLFDDGFHWFFNYVSLALHYFEDVVLCFSIFFIIFKMVLIVFHWLFNVFTCSSSFHWFLNVLKLFFIMFHYMLGRFFAIYMHILHICSTWKTGDSRKFEILEFWGLQD